MENMKRKTISFNISLDDEKFLNDLIKNNIYINSMSHLVEIAVFEFMEKNKIKETNTLKEN